MKHYLTRSNLTFSSQKKLKEYAVGICRKNLNIIVDTEHVDYGFFVDMFERHPTKKFDEETDTIMFQIVDGTKSVNFDIQPPLTTQEPFRAYFKLGSTTWNSFSLLKKCIDKKPNTNEDIKGTFRNEISEQLSTFNEQNRYICAVCSSHEHLDIDHIVPFADILKGFTDDNGFSDDIGKKSGSYKYYFNNRNYAEKWKTYHQDNSSLQYLCKSCHKHKTSIQRGRNTV
jgi:5-methylcytosine-specific restriction endonuclease McrA